MFKKKISLGLVLISVVYLVTHLIGLLELPVFADEAIYIRWAQLIIDDPSRYLFFAMNDGKTPLFFWMLVPFQYLFSNQLYAARFVSVLIGLVQMLVVMKITELFTKSKKTLYFAGFMVMILPYWYFHHRMALTDGLLTLCISFAMYYFIKIARGNNTLPQFTLYSITSRIFGKLAFYDILFAGIFFGLALLSKIPAVLCLPAFYLVAFLTRKRSFETLLFIFAKITLSILIGLGIFGLLRFAPAFGQLFGRGSDFLFPLEEVLSGKWRETIPSIPTYIGYFISYMTPMLLLFSLTGLFTKKNKVAVHVFFWSGVLFLLPIALMGKIVYARYLFPAVLFFTLSSVLGVEALYTWIKQQSQHLWSTVLGVGILVILLANTVAISSVFVVQSMTNHRDVPFVSSDVMQYLTEWSSGHGLVETSALIRDIARTQSVAVATEGSFGTLPDGLFLYFHRTDLENIFIDGIGLPVVNIPERFAVQAAGFERKLLVVNENRMQIPLHETHLLAEYCRPFNAPCLQVWDITKVFETPRVGE